MAATTTTLAIFIRHPGDSARATEVLRPFLLPYLTNLAGSAWVTREDRLRELGGKSTGRRVTVFEVHLSEGHAVPLEELATKLEKFLKRAATDADVTAAFEIFFIESTAHSQRDDESSRGRHE